MSGAHDQICLWGDHCGCAGAGVWRNSTAAMRAEGQCQEIQHGRPCREAVGGGCGERGPALWLQWSSDLKSRIDVCGKAGARDGVAGH